ncbi:PDZ domain-containing protein [Pedobacter chinensis]|uniref:PDZ domain-containing protein n=1 Tax=Pedobacter chinensis TaxID=2282421 RepID=A0A369PWM1_9SPHI|nr:aspartyl protease family protein [Pedobacter chinensis]RDC56904.1 PDZ domain-containing protein [Pedobacter chinensis]
MLTKYEPVILFSIRKLAICAGLFLMCLHSFAQEFTFSGKKQRQSIQFRCIKNLIIIPVYVNDKGPYDFVLDTGVGPMIITEPSIIDTLNFNLMRKIRLSGLGLETVDAYVSQNVEARIGRAKIKHIPTAILKEDLFNLSGHLGVKIYGLIGYSFFNSFIVDIRYSENRIIFSDLDSHVKYRGSKVPITIENLKPYVDVEVEIPDSGKISTRFLMDTGASHALSMEMLNGAAFPLPEKRIKANLGMSLSGQIKGYVGRVKTFHLGKYAFSDVVAGFPDFESISKKIDLSFRNGNLGAEILRKFDVQFNYQEKFMYLKPNNFAKVPFQHDMVGMVVYLDQDQYKRVIIGEIDEGSPAEKAGLCPNDQIIGVNFKSIDAYSLNDLTEMFKSKADRVVIFEVFRDNQVLFKVVRLEKRI